MAVVTNRLKACILVGVAFLTANSKNLVWGVLHTLAVVGLGTCCCNSVGGYVPLELGLWRSLVTKDLVLVAFGVNNFVYSGSNGDVRIWLRKDLW